MATGLDGKGSTAKLRKIKDHDGSVPTGIIGRWATIDTLSDAEQNSAVPDQ